MQNKFSYDAFIDEKLNHSNYLRNGIEALCTLASGSGVCPMIDSGEVNTEDAIHLA